MTETGCTESALESIQVVSLEYLRVLWKGFLNNFWKVKCGQCPEGVRIEV